MTAPWLQEPHPGGYPVTPTEEQVQRARIAGRTNTNPPPASPPADRSHRLSKDRT